MKQAVIRSQGGVMALGVALVCGCTAAPSISGNARETKAPQIAAPATSATLSNPVTEKSESEARSDFWLASDPVQGGLVIGRAPSGALTVMFNAEPISVSHEGFFLIGFDRDAENSASLVAILENGKKVEKYLPVRPGDWDIEHVNTRMTGGAKTSAEFQQRRGPELARINAARSSHAAVDGWRQEFVWPVTGRLSGLFGSQRIYQGTPGSYHSGMDIAVPSGTPFIAPADGVVTLVANEPFTLEGHLLMLDHGMGLNSAFLHCSEILVKEGDFVKQGQVIGRVGMTGRASGPHLHWGMKWNAARVDPKLLVPKL